MVEEQVIASEAWEELGAVIDSGNADHLEAFLQLLPPGEMAYTIGRLSDEQKTRMLELIRPQFAADLMLYLSDEHAADLIEELRPQAAAAIVDELDSDDQADILLELDEDDQRRILEAMDPEEAADARRLIEYDPETAGGVMYTEFLAYPVEARIDDIIDDMRRKSEEYDDIDFHYLYMTDDDGRLVGVLPMRHLLIGRPDRRLATLMIKEPVRVHTNATLYELDELLAKYDFISLPVVDDGNKLVGVVAREAVEEAIGEKAELDLQSFGGIIGGEEIRTMPVFSRSIKRLAYLVPMIFLMIVSASVIAAFEESVLSKVIALAIFLPMVAGLAGCSGNQALAVSIREMSQGLVKPTDLVRVLQQEFGVGIAVGIVLGAILFGVGAVWANVAGWPGGPWLGLVIGASIPATIVFAVTLGGAVPLFLKRVNIDPAMASGPIITTAVDFFAFFAVLGLALLLIEKLT